MILTICIGPLPNPCSPNDPIWFSPSVDVMELVVSHTPGIGLLGLVTILVVRRRRRRARVTDEVLD